MNAFMLTAAAVAAACCYTLVRQLRPELAPMVLISGIAVVLSMALPLLTDTMAGTDSLLGAVGLSTENVRLLLKCSCLCALTRISADIGRDNGAASLAGAVDLAGSAAAVLTAMPMIVSVAGTALELINKEMI